MHPGAQQDQRLPPALAPGYARPDEQDVAARLARTLAMARQLRFVDAQGRPAGRWGDALATDGALLLAELATLPVAQWQERLRDDGPWLDDALRTACLGLAQRLDRWYAALRDAADAQAADDTLFHPLAAWLREVLRTQLGPRLRPLIADPRAWHPDWHVDSHADGHVDGQAGPLAAPDAPDAPVDAARAGAGPADIRLLWLALCRVLQRLRDFAAIRVEPALANGRHDPAAGLLLAWTQLLQHSREPLNAFNERLVDHYYAERLALPRLPAGAQRVWLVLDAAPLLAEPVPLDPAQRFVAALPRGSRSFVLEQAPALQPSRVARLLTLRQLRDPLISPQREYGYASAVVAASIDPPTPEAAAEPRAPVWGPLGGGPGAHPARIGLAIASPLLLLREGTRRIQLNLEIAGPVLPAGGEEARFAEVARFETAFQEASEQAEPGPRESADRLMTRVRRLCPSMARQPWLAYLWARCLASADPAALPRRLGRLLAVWLCASAEVIDEHALALLRRHARRVLERGGLRAAPVDVDDPLAMLCSDQPLERSLIFNRVFHDAWRARVSSDTGWQELGAALVAWPADGPRGLQLRLQLGADLPATGVARPGVHGAGWPEQPVLQLVLEGRSRLFPASLLQQLTLAAVRVQVEVKGLRSVQLYNQLGQLDPSKPFMPFGPLPDTSAYLQFSHVELMRKPLTRLRARMRFAGLPAITFAQQYAGYPDDPWTPEVFRVRAELLRDGRWQDAAQPPLALFPAAGGGQPPADQALDLSSPAWLSLHAPQPEAASADYSLRSRQGFFRLKLDGPAEAFGHALYPRVLSERLTQNSRRKEPLPLPLPPYTPVLEFLRIDYAAQERIAARPLGADMPGAAADPAQSRLFHLAPFGVQPLRSLPRRHPLTVLPAEPADGQLLIGLSGQAPSGTLSLLFLLRAESALEALGRPSPALRWEAWCGGDWRALEPHRLLLDATDGLLRSGLVLLDLPDGLSADCPSLPPGLFWLRLLGDGPLDLLAAARGVWVNGVAVRLEGPPRDEVLPPLSIRAAQTPVPGLAGLHQPWPSLPQRMAEDRPAWKQRVAERMRHRDRAVTPGDVERLVLEAFPQVFKVKCLPLSAAHAQGPGPHTPAEDRVIVVVVPALPAGHEIDGTEGPRLDAATLLRVRRFLLPRIAPGHRLLVRNATYDRIQVRCALRLSPGEPAGRRLRELNQALRDFFSPWRPGGLTARFDWRVRAEEIEAFLRAQPGVEAVGGASLLHVTRDDTGTFRLGDSARGDRALRPRAPWSLALPTRGHLLELTGDPGGQPAVSGLAQLSIGGSFIIGRAAA